MSGKEKKEIEFLIVGVSKKVFWRYKDQEDERWKYIFSFDEKKMSKSISQ